MKIRSSFLKSSFIILIWPVDAVDDDSNYLETLSVWYTDLVKTLGITPWTPGAAMCNKNNPQFFTTIIHNNTTRKST